MDSLTHIVLGAAIGEVVLGKKIGRKAMLWGALADTIPDFDVFGSFCFSNAQQLLVHRGITHSILFVSVISFLLGWIFYKYSKKKSASQKEWTILFLLGMFTHIIIDSFTSYGTGWFEPFSSYRVSFNTIFVADLFYTIPFLICMVIAIIAKNNSPTRKRFTKLGLIISTLYMCFTLVNKFYVTHKMEEALNKKNIPHSDFVSTPTPLNNILWTAYAADNTGYWFGYYSLFDKSDINYYHVNKKDDLLKPYENENEVKLLKQFSKGYYCASFHDSAVYFNDIRFGQMGGWDAPDSTFVFSFKLNKNSDNRNALSRTKFKTSFGDAFSSLVNRIKGR
jgi:inner membrane protein